MVQNISIVIVLASKTVLLKVCYSGRQQTLKTVLKSVSMQTRKQRQQAEKELELVLNETYIRLPLFMYISLGETKKNNKKINVLMLALLLLRGFSQTVLTCSLIGPSAVCFIGLI